MHPAITAMKAQNLLKLCLRQVSVILSAREKLYSVLLEWDGVVVHWTWTVSWTTQSCFTRWILAIQVPVISTASSSVVRIISERQGPLWALLCAPSTAAFAVTLALRAALSFFETHSTRRNAVGRCRSRLDLPSVTATPTSVVGVIAEILCPSWALAPTGARASSSLTLRASFRLLKAETILLVWLDVFMCLDFPLVVTASTSIFGVISKLLSPGRIGTPSAACVFGSLTLRATFSFLKANPEPILSPAVWNPHDDGQERNEASVQHVSHVWFRPSWQGAEQSGSLICVNPTIKKTIVRLFSYTFIF